MCRELMLIIEVDGSIHELEEVMKTIRSRLQIRIISFNGWNTKQNELHTTPNVACLRYYQLMADMSWKGWAGAETPGGKRRNNRPHSNQCRNSLMT